MVDSKPVVRKPQVKRSYKVSAGESSMVVKGYGSASKLCRFYLQLSDSVTITIIREVK